MMSFLFSSAARPEKKKEAHGNLHRLESGDEPSMRKRKEAFSKSAAQSVIVTNPRKQSNIEINSRHPHPPAPPPKHTCTLCRPDEYRNHQPQSHRAAAAAQRTIPLITCIYPQPGVDAPNVRLYQPQLRGCTYMFAIDICYPAF